jgi:hypothetical protein
VPPRLSTFLAFANLLFDIIGKSIKGLRGTVTCVPLICKLVKEIPLD